MWEIWVFVTVAFCANVVLFLAIFLALRDKPILLLRKLPIISLTGIVLTLLIFTLSTAPTEVIQIILVALLSSTPWLCGFFWTLRIQMDPIEIKSIVFDITSSLLFITEPELAAEYPIPYKTLKRYRTRVPIEFHNRSDRAIVIQSVWLETWPVYPRHAYSLNPFKRGKLLMKPLRLSDFGWEVPLPLEVPPKGQKTIMLNVFYFLALCDATKDIAPVPSARFVVKHSFGTTNSKIFGLASFHHFYQKMTMSLVRRDFETIVDKDISKGVAPEDLYKNVVATYSKRGYDEITAVIFLLWHLQSYYPGKKDYINYVQQQHDRIVKPLAEAFKRKLTQFKISHRSGN